MQTVKQAILDLSYVMGLPRKRVNTIGRALIDADVLPKSSGRDIKKIDAAQLGAFVAALAMAEKADEAADIAKQIMNLRLSGDPEGERFKVAFAANINTSDDEARPIVTFNRMHSGFSAELEGRFILNGNLSEGRAPYWKQRSWDGYTKTSFTLSKEGFEVLRNLFRRAYDSEGNPVYGAD